MTEPSSRKLGLVGLTAIVFGSMVGGGIFALPQNVGDAACPGPVMIAWGITAIGILALVMCFKCLADTRPDLNAGLFQYAKEGWGSLAAFVIAWGYWLCAAFGNVAYAVMIIDAFGGFFPSLLEHGWQAALLGTALLWTMYVIVVNGIKTASAINTAISVLKMAAIFLIIVIMVLGFNADLFSFDVWGSFSPDLDGVGAQVKNTMLVTLWCFVGIEGAVAMGARAKRKKDVGRAGLIGFAVTWGVYVLVSLLCFGIMNRAELASLPEPSVAYVLRAVCGDWAFVMVLVTVIVSLLGGWVAWALICAQVPYQASCLGIFPGRFRHLNRHGMPGYVIFVSTAVMQIFLLMVLVAPQAYLKALDITTMMALPAYFVAALYLCKLSLKGGTVGQKVAGFAATAYCLWMMYAGGLDLLMETSIFYVMGLSIFFEMRRRVGSGRLHGREWIAVGLLGIAALASLWRLCSGDSNLM